MNPRSLLLSLLRSYIAGNFNSKGKTIVKLTSRLLVFARFLSMRIRSSSSIALIVLIALRLRQCTLVNIHC